MSPIDTCFFDGMYYGQGLELYITHSDVEGETECQRKCKNNDRCQYFTYEIAAKTCSLQTKTGIFNTLRDNFFISGPKQCVNVVGNKSKTQLL